MKLTTPLLLLGLALVACSDKPAEKKGALPTLITITQAKPGSLELVERTLGTIEAVNDPKISAEVAGKIVRIAVRAGESVKKGQLLAQIDPTDLGHQAQSDQSEIARLQALLSQQEKLVSRQNELVQKNFISKNALDDVTAQRDALKNQLASANSRAAISQNNHQKARIVAPFDGVIEEKIASNGDYVKVGDPLFRLISNRQLRAHLPFPEHTAAKIKPGMLVRLSSPLSPESEINGVVEDIRPSITESSRAIDVITRLDNPGFLKGGGSINASVITGTLDNAIQVPEQSVVLRPAGKVVYLVNEGKVTQQVVETGSKQRGLVEIRQGLKGGETIALDGAGFLSNNAAIAIKENKTKAAADNKPVEKPADPAIDRKKAPETAK
jgi:RND family efflux transporter MFP subunit